MRLTEREKELLAVTRDLFLKGSTEYRVAKYAHERGLTRQQFMNFLDKLDKLGDTVKIRIMTRFSEIERGEKNDESVMWEKY